MCEKSHGPWALIKKKLLIGFDRQKLNARTKKQMAFSNPNRSDHFGREMMNHTCLLKNNWSPVISYPFIRFFELELNKQSTAANDTSDTTVCLMIA